MEQKKEEYLKPEMVKHELLRDITANSSAYGGSGSGNGSGGHCNLVCVRF